MRGIWRGLGFGAEGARPIDDIDDTDDIDDPRTEGRKRRGAQGFQNAGGRTEGRRQRVGHIILQLSTLLPRDTEISRIAPLGAVC